MNGSPAISVIIPVYKAEAYLSRCVDSFMAQTFADFELLLVDDGSPDRSGEICDEYAAKDSRIRVFHKENGGVATARQCGVDNAHGEYVIQADPDDWVEPDMLEVIYRKAKDENADMVIFDFIMEYEDSRVYTVQRPLSLDYMDVCRGLFYNLFPNTWNKMVRRDVILRNHVAFHPKLRYAEDLYFLLGFLMQPVRVSYVNRAFYHYDKYTNTNALTKNYSPDMFRYDMETVRFFDELVKGSYIEEHAHHDRIMSAIRKAFYSRIFSSGEFKELCSSYAESVKYMIEHTSGISSKDRLFFTLMYYSCKGYYSVAYRMYSMLISAGKLRRRMFG